MPISPKRSLWIPTATFARGLGVMCLFFGAVRAAESPLIRVSFETRTVVVAGSVDTEATAEAIVAALRSARPDLAPDRTGLIVDPSVTLPDLTEFPSLLAELGLSTHEGRLELWPDRLVIGGLTDSLVTQSALRIRAQPFLKGRHLHNRLCIVSTEDLPKLEVSLAGANAGRLETAPEVAPVATPAGGFEMPGLSFAKLLAVIRLPGQIDRLSGKTSTPAPAPPVGGAIRAEPVAAPSAPPGPAMPLTATPVQTFETLPSVLFSRSSFLLQANQQATIEGLSKHLLSPARRGAPVRIEAVKASGGSTAFNEYLCERRAAEVARFLTEAGVEPSLLSMKTIESPSPVDGGEVRLFVEILPPVEPPVPVTAGTTTPTTTPPDAAPASATPEPSVPAPARAATAP